MSITQIIIGKYEKKDFVKIVLDNNDRKSNWFVNVGTGTNIYLNKNESSTSLGHKMTINYNLTGGEWFSTTFGLRLAIQGGKIHTFGTNNNIQTMSSISYLNVHPDLLFNLTHYISPSVDRKYSFIPNIGIGYMRGDNNANLFRTKGFNGPSINIGLLNSYKFSNRISAFAELGTSFVEGRFDKQNQTNDFKTNWSTIVSVNAGISINLGKTGLREIYLLDIKEVARLNYIINTIKNERNPIGCYYPVHCPPVQPCPPAPTNTDGIICGIATNTVFFKINSAIVDDNQLITLYNFSELLKNNPTLKLNIIGYADKETGSKAYNLKLSKKRAENTAKILIETYGIEKDRLIIDAKGSTEQVYKDNKWNRVVILLVV